MGWDGMGYVMIYDTIRYDSICFDTLYSLGVQVQFIYCLCTEELN